jgi:hypothetical protein
VWIKTLKTGTLPETTFGLLQIPRFRSRKAGRLPEIGRHCFGRARRDQGPEDGTDRFGGAGQSRGFVWRSGRFGEPVQRMGLIVVVNVFRHGHGGGVFRVRIESFRRIDDVAERQSWKRSRFGGEVKGPARFVSKVCFGRVTEEIGVSRERQPVSAGG